MSDPKEIRIKNPNALMNEGPTAIGMMSTIIEGGGSLDSAVRDVAKNGPKNISLLLQGIVADADVRRMPDVRTGLADMLSRLPFSVTPLRRALHMAAVASESLDLVEKRRMLSNAADISLNGLREMGDSYSASLNMPCMTIFGLGIMVPMVLMTILPMLSMGDMFGTMPIGQDIVIMMTLVIIPSIILGVMLSLRDRNPFLTERARIGDARHAIPATIGMPVAFLVWSLTESVGITLVASVSASGVAMAASLMLHVKEARLVERQEQLLKDSVFELGNRLISGENFETAIVEAIGVRKECKGIVRDLSMELMLCRGDVHMALKRSIGPVSLSSAEIYCNIFSCSMKDTREAGRLAISIGRQLQDQDIVRKDIRNKLKGMVDMMVGTAAVFAPLVLGMSISMLEPLSRMSEGIDSSVTSLVLSVYLIELGILISILTTFLNGRGNLKDILFKIGSMLPISMLVFTACSSLM